VNNQKYLPAKDKPEIVFCFYDIYVRGSPLIAVMIHVIAASTPDYYSEVDN